MATQTRRSNVIGSAAATARKAVVRDLLAGAGIAIDGQEPWDLQVHHDRFYTHFLRGDTLALGESYMDGDWECTALDQLFFKLWQADFADRVRSHPRLLLQVLASWISNPGRRARAFEIGRRHYDLGNDLFVAMLDRRMVYSCAYWRDSPRDLDEAQEAKLDLICRKIGLTPGMRVLDIGGGWGSFARFAAERYGARVVNITVSREQVQLANTLTRGLTVENRLQDYRDVNERFDRIVSIGMIEHVGYKNYPRYMDVVRRCLRDDGLFLLQTIGGNLSQTTVDPWVERYLFPNSMIPSIQQLSRAAESRFVVEDWHNFGADYDPTLMAWWQNFDRHWPDLKERYGERFYRMWKLYLLGCAGTFRARVLHLWQVVFSPKGVPGGYYPVR
jgi:cyclopropane-fatty-acyl-phospholipid synthase